MTSKLDRLMMLQEEVKIAKKFVEEHDRRYGLCKYCNQLYERKNS